MGKHQNGWFVTENPNRKWTMNVMNGVFQGKSYEHDYESWLGVPQFTETHDQGYMRLFSKQELEAVKNSRACRALNSTSSVEREPVDLWLVRGLYYPCRILMHNHELGVPITKALYQGMTSRRSCARSGIIIIILWEDRNIELSRSSHPMIRNPFLSLS